MYFDVDGVRAFASTGDAAFDNKKPTVVFLHGAGVDYRFWAAQAAILASPDYSVLAPDFPGHTNSEGAPLASIELMADWLHGAFDVLVVKDISLDQESIVGIRTHHPQLILARLCGLAAAQAKRASSA